MVAPFPLAGEQAGEPLALLCGQARHEVGEGIGGRFVRVFWFASGNAGGITGRARRKSRQVLSCDRYAFAN
jgi:hypothetical protein